jgi:hypothetical protein
MEIKDITSEPLTTVSELIDLQESLIGSGGEFSPRRWAFRGQPQDYGTLAPSFQRQFSRHSYGTAELIERTLIEAFRKHYSALRDRSGDMPFPERIGLGYDLRCLSVMQHYEIPTRLLDWTSDFWTAIYFACASDPDNKAELWYYDRQMFDDQRLENKELATFVDPSQNPPCEPSFLDRRREELVVELDPQITPRMKNQFAHHTVSTDVFADHAKLILALLATYPAQNDGPPVLRRVLIDGACKSKALKFLSEHMNITASTIFPDVVGIGRFLRWQFESLRSMLL